MAITELGAEQRRRRRQARPWPVVVVLAVATSVTSVQQTAVLPLLGRLRAELHAPLTSVAWAFTASLLVGAVATPLLGRMGDLYGRRRVLLAALGALAAGSVLGALSTSLAVLVVARVLQGVSMAALPLTVGIVRGALPREKLPAGLGVVSATMGVGVGGGLVLAGVVARFTEGYRAVFWVMAALAVAAALVVALVVRDAESGRTGGRLDLPGAALLSGTLVSLLLGISQGQAWGWLSGRVLALFAAAVVLGVLWIVVERRTDDPLVDVAMLTHRGTVGASVSSLLLGFALYGGFTLIPNFVQAPARAGYGFGASVLAAGLFLLPTTLLMIAVSTQAGRLMRRMPASVLVAAGSALTALAAGWLAFFHAHRWDVYGATVLLGVGIGLAFAALGTMAVEHVRPEQTAVASAVNSLVRLVGGGVAGALTTAILARDTLPGSAVPSEHAYATGFALSGVVALLAAVAALAFHAAARKRR
ncbi:MFS transporter [Actinomadura rupiterrae]|uniref:MFS transporter n=1 Tax=Actinomadura rupiterrae TaxID=559627 RepID=UPI0020A4A920|nr:MFS transporter [Actinomadura rupiterrae]MCP2335627.1 MFS family permease [Actinomadura rupiterrae]